MLTAILVFAQAPPAQSDTPWWYNFIQFLPIIVLGYLLFIRPMQKQERDRNKLIASLKKNDKVITSGGLIGVVYQIKEKEDEVLLKIDENSNVRVKVTKASIVRVVPDEPVKQDK